MHSTLSARRFWFANIVVTGIFALISYQLIQLSIIRQPALESLAKKQHQIKIEIPPLRGQILDRYGKELATSLKVPSIYAVPRLIEKERKAEIAQKIGKVLGLDSGNVLNRLSRDKSFVWVKRKVSYEQAEKIREMKDASLGVLNEYRRFYPQGSLLAQVMGFVDIDNRGLEGIELSLNDELQGKTGLRCTKRDALGREIKAFEMKVIPAIDGNRVYLTVDQYLQFLTERSLANAFQKWKAKGAAAVLLEAKTGRILAIANQPSYDSNDYERSSVDPRRDRAVTDMYEPGSIFKIITASAVLNENKVKMEDTFFCENGSFRYSGGKVLHDVHAYGTLTFPEVLIKSSNIGICKVAQLLKPDMIYRYIRNFGFGELSGIDLPGEAPGFIRAPSQWSNTSPFNIPMGQEVQVTLVQMAVAMAVIANGGDLVKPYIISRIEDQAGVSLREKKPIIKRQVIRPEVSEKMRGILVRAVEEGTGKMAKINGIAVGGKTGTAQKTLAGGKGYSHNNFMSSFIGFGPAEDPQIVMAIVVDDPKPLYYGGTVAAPIFKEVMEPALYAIGYVPKNLEVFEAVKNGRVPRENPPTLPPARNSGKAILPR